MVPPYPAQWASDKLTVFFTEHLNRIYCAKAHLAERLLEIADTDSFKDLDTPIKETLGETEKQIARIDGVYAQLQKRYSFENCSGLISLLEDEFTAIHQHNDDEVLRDMCILSYLEYVSGVEKNSMQVLQLTAIEKNNEPMIRFLDEHLNNSKTRHKLYDFLLAKYDNNRQAAISL
ncbi:DUF892 family protein [Mucilaginibacter rubeus]|nr:DUF892 family protein [Mucilaginibacter rubeus]